MKKDIKTEPDIAELLVKMQQQLSLLDIKIDTLIGRSAEKQRFDYPHRRD